ncbi:hypothetical protein [Actinomadura rupiterrae]|uniref:hypothetical protein n=1 Tax=Actinomadura rupiterrae TaxID=559627 RepID=UPI0020A2C81E|nr:hypothetical protein [Actinomadura rupiterrae]MCP2337488.1 hypothetical protein [Actinomadura rupiterrae]
MSDGQQYLYYETFEDRKIMRFRDLLVRRLEIRPHFVIQLDRGVSFESTALPYKKSGPETGAATTSFAKLPSQDLETLIGSRPLVWLIFDDGHHLMVFSNEWHVLLAPRAGDTWKLDVPGYTPLTYPSAEFSSNTPG